MFHRLWVPAIISSFGWAISDIADAVVVGQKLGAVGLATIGLILPVYMVNCMFAHGFGLGGSVRYSRLMGEGKHEDAVNSFNGVFWLSLCFSIVTAILGNIFLEPILGLLGAHPADQDLYLATKGYFQILVTASPLFYLSNILNYFLRNDESQQRAGIGSVAGNLCDICFNIILVLILDMGTRGAALATALGQIVAISIYLPGFFRKNHSLRITMPQLKWVRAALSALRAGLATSIHYMYQMTFFLICNNLLIRLGGESAVAVFDVIQNTSYLILYLFDGTGRAMQPLLSTYQGEHNKLGIKRVLRLGFAHGLGVGGLMILLVEMWPMGLCMLFGIDGSASGSLAYIALRLYADSALFGGISILLCSYFQACENPRPSFLLETLRGLVLLIPMTFLCYQLGLKYFWCLFLLTEAGALLIFSLMFLTGKYRREGISEDRIFHRMIHSKTETIMDVCHELEEFCDSLGANRKQKMLAIMTLEEIGMAILTHGFLGNTEGYIQITAIMEEDGLLELHLRDDAITFNPFDMHTQKANKDLDFDMDSMGVLLIKKQAKSFLYRRYQGFNSLIIKI